MGLHQHVQYFIGLCQGLSRRYIFIFRTLGGVWIIFSTTQTGESNLVSRQMVLWCMISHLATMFLTC